MHQWRVIQVLALAVAAALVGGCGYITDKDRIKIARIGDEFITRGDFARILREMPDEERPAIHTRGDLRSALENHLNDVIKESKGLELQQEGKIEVPREAARGAYFQQHPEHRQVMEIRDASVMDISQEELETLKLEVELAIDRMEDRLLAEYAIGYLGQQALRNNTVEITDAQFEREYNVRKESLKTLEQMDFIAIRFPASMEDAPGRAAEVRRRLDQGETMGELVAEFRSTNPELVFESSIENNPEAPKFRGFWMTASGAEEGDIIGPVFLPSYQLMAVDQSGQARVREMPEAYLVLQVQEHEPEQIKSLEEAKPELAPSIVYAEMMKRLREEEGVEVFEENLPDPQYIWESL